MAGTIQHEWNGSILTITSDSGTSSMDLRGPQGDTGIRGPQGIAGAKGDTGQGEKGDAFKYEDFTAEQLEALRGPAGLTGPQGEQGAKGAKGEKGDAFTYDDFTPEQLEALRGPQGLQGPMGPAGVGVVITQISGSATVADGANMTFYENPFNYDAIFGRVAFVGTAIALIAGSTGSRYFKLYNNVSSNAGIDINTLTLTETATETELKANTFKKININTSGNTSYSAPDTYTIGPFYGLKWTVNNRVL